MLKSCNTGSYSAELLEVSASQQKTGRESNTGNTMLRGRDTLRAAGLREGAGERARGEARKRESQRDGGQNGERSNESIILSYTVSHGGAPL